uniref:Transcription factor TFIIB cyclin-like domain-containing protein n=1 Tax=Arcella intermedia TaxID=1963864 RepID=A0A6B2LLK0_9EUKA
MACGRVAQEKIIDTTAEWRDFDGEEGGKARAETVDDVLGDVSTLPTPPSSKTRGPVDPLVGCIARLGELVVSLDLKADVKTAAKGIYKQFSTHIRGKKVRGSRSDAMLLAVLFYALKECKVPRTFKELSSASGESFPRSPLPPLPFSTHLPRQGSARMRS